MKIVPSDFVLVEDGGRRVHIETAQDFVDAVLKRVPTLETLEALYAFWEINLDNLNRLRTGVAGTSRDDVQSIILALKTRARELGTSRKIHDGDADETSEDASSDLKIPKEKRLRRKDHLAFVARQPCLVCGRRPAQAHHLRFAQPRAMGLKVSDEYTLPLCAGHHDALHRTGDERAWWARHGIKDPLDIAARLWSASRLGSESNGLTSSNAPIE